MKKILILLLVIITPFLAIAQTLDSTILDGLQFRNIGPAFMSGRISDIAIDPKDETLGMLL